MEKVRPWCGQPSDRGRLRNRTEHYRSMGHTDGVITCLRPKLAHLIVNVSVNVLLLSVLLSMFVYYLHFVA